MRSENRNNYESMRELYYRWLNERDVFEQRRLKEEIKSRFSPYEFLNFSIKNSFMPFKAFRNIYSLDVLFQTLEKMQRQGENISNLTNQQLLISNPEDIRSMSYIAKRDISPELSSINCIFLGTSVFSIGDVKAIGKKFPKAHVNGINIEQIEKMLESSEDYRGMPITIAIDNMGQLPLEKLADIEKRFDIRAIEIQDPERIGKANQGASTPLALETYKEIRAIADDMISNLYVKEHDANTPFADYRLATQIIEYIAQRVEYDYSASDKERDSDESMSASGMVGLLTGQAICHGYSEILRNLLSCVGIECKVISGKAMDGESHAWNQVKIGNGWYNVDLTYASNALRQGKDTGDLFMYDKAFYGDRKIGIFEEGMVRNGESLERTVMIGGHSPNSTSPNCKQCANYMPPALTSKIIKESKHYEEEYKRYGKLPDYKGVVPYIGSSIEKMRSSAKNIETPTYSEH